MKKCLPNKISEKSGGSIQKHFDFPQFFEVFLNIACVVAVVVDVVVVAVVAVAVGHLLSVALNVIGRDHLLHFFPSS